MSSFLAALDYHYDEDFRASTDATEVEYLLHSWGEIFPPFLGNREHSDAARFILNEYPFKLFSSNVPYEGPVPYRLTATFLAPIETKIEDEVGSLSGVFPNEIAQGFAAFLSVYTRRRVFHHHSTRASDMPIIQEPASAPSAVKHQGQRMREIDPTELYRLLSQLQAMPRHLGRSFVLAMQLYHAAIEQLFSRSESAYLSLITALEAISSVAYDPFTHPQEDAFLQSKFPGWQDFATSAEQQASLREILLRNEHFAFAKLAQFVEDYLPEKFWEEENDDAKPEHLSAWVGTDDDGHPREHIERDQGKIQDYEKIDRSRLRGILRALYNARSGLSHRGEPLPASIVVGLSDRIPVEATHELIRAAQGGEDRIPPLLALERLVSYCLVEFLARRGGAAE